MRNLKLLAIVLLLAVPTLTQADMPALPASATWYFHADLDAMRSGKAGRTLYDWMDGEVFEEIRGEVGIDVGKEAKQVTAFAAAGEGPIILIDGNISQDTKDKLLAIGTAQSGGNLQTFESDGKDYYFFAGNGERDDDRVSPDEAAYVSFALKNKVLVTKSKKQMTTLLASNGKIDRGKPEKNALFVLRADRGLIQAGLDADQLDDSSDWNSNILRNTRQVAVLLADLGDKLGFEAQLMTNEADMANAMASIVRGLISLQAFNDDLDPELSSTLQSTTVDVDGNRLKIALALDPAVVVSALED
ncbi:MAG: hypothetical protein KJO46_06555 [Gammaproteobacteria bacterium]|nr:hypothetical protein [Gammaproteobacteria bacterium]